MLFSKRQELEREYYKWIQIHLIITGEQILDCPSSVMVFLDKKGYLKNKESKWQKRLDELKKEK